MFYYIMLYYVILYYIIAFDEGECSRNLVLGVLCHTARKNQGFLCNGSRRCQFSPPPPPKIFAGAYSQPETGMDFGLAFMMPRPQTVNLAYKNTSAGEHGFWLRYFVYFLGVF